MLSEILVTITICIDICLMAVNYSASNIKIPKTSAIIMSFISAVILYISLFLAEILKNLIPLKICSIIGFILLTSIGAMTILKSITRYIVKKLSKSGDICIKMNKLGIGVRLYLDETTADLDYSKVLSAIESVMLSLALSIDSFAVGINAGLLGANPLRTSFFAFIFGILSIILGGKLGVILTKGEKDFAWLGGIMLILIAIMGII